MAKFAILAQPQKSDMGRAVHSLLYTQQLHQAGHDVALYYEGEGTTWIGRFEDPAFKYHDLYREVQGAGLIAGACSYCAEAFGVRNEIAGSPVPFVDHDRGHPSVAQLVAEGRTIITV